MGTRNSWSGVAKTCLTAGLLGIAVQARYGHIDLALGESSQPPISNCNLIWVETRHCLEKFEFSRGDFVSFKCPLDHTKRLGKRIIALPGDYINNPLTNDVVKVPEGHCWVEGDNADNSFDSRHHGSIPMGLITGKATYVLWPPREFGKLESKIPEGRLPSLPEFTQ